MGVFSNLTAFMKNEHPLIADLKTHHKELFKIFDKIHTYAHKGKIDKIPDKLKEFYYKYKKHVLYEEQYFYNKLQKLYHNNNETKFLLELKKAEMQKITRAVEKFITKFSHIDIIAKDIELFKKELMHIGEVLKKRIEYEEKELFLLYKK